MAKRFSIETVFKGIDKMTGPVRKMQKGASKFTRGFSKGLRAAKRGTDALAGGLKKMLAVGAVGFAILLAGIVSVSQVGSEFEQKMVNASAKMGILNRHIGEGKKQFDALSAAARKSAIETEFTAIQSAEALEFMGQAGFSAAEAIGGLPEVLDLASATATELAQASDIVTDTLDAFNMRGKTAVETTANINRISGVLSKTTSDTNTNLEMMFETIKKAAAVAKGGGGDIETFAAIAGQLAGSGIKASVAGTAMKSMFAKMAAPADKAKKILKKFQIQTMDSGGNLLDMIDILGEMEDKFKDLGTGQKLAVFKELFGERGMVAVNALMTKGIGTVKDYRKALQEQENTHKKLAETMRDTFGAEWIMLNALN
jgi:TP901 family phage tail tape measure protein